MKEAEPLGIRARACLDPDGLVEGEVALAVTHPTFALAGFQLRLYLDDGLMQPDKQLFCCSYLLQVSPSLSRSELSACCVVFLTEFGLPIVQDLADALRACSGDRCGVRSRIAGRRVRSHK